jgi:regulator of RNase E activity RraA/CMP-N-acetylneuraminic acid synthetase
MKIVAFVPAKGASERVPSKNVRILDGEHLFRRKLKQLLECPLIDEVWLDTESDAIISLAGDLPIKVLKRDSSLATNSTDGHEMFENECRAAPDADIVIQAVCTAPFVGSKTVTSALERLLAEERHDSLVGVRHTKQYCWNGTEPLYGRGRIPNSVDLPETVVEAMSLYMVRRSSPEFPRKRFGLSPLLFGLTELEAIDINYPEDMEVAETICMGERTAEFSYFRVLKHHLSSSVLSDVTKEMGFEFMLDKSLRPISGGKMLGRVKTLKLGKLTGSDRDIHASEAWKGIYKALDSYAFVRTGDVIVVENEVPDRAYFGDLNCHLALRAGAVGVLVDGVTRDVSHVRAMGLPVYARGAWSNDIKYEGTTLGYNVPVCVGGRTARNDDVIFADAEGILIIPREYWPRALEAALTAVSTEGQIRQGLLAGVPVDKIIRDHGFF